VHPAGKGLSNMLRHNDSRAILSKRDKALPLLFDHKSTNDVELRRMEGRFGMVEWMATWPCQGALGTLGTSQTHLMGRRITV
jgi:hypothetical protein